MWRRQTIGTVIALAAVFWGCSGNATPQAAPMAGWGELGPDSVTGTIRQVGNLPFVRTQVDGDEGRSFVSGQLESEIGRLAGMRVLVTGVFTEGDQPGPYIRATSYEILEFDGERPVVGVLGRDANGWFLALFDGDAYRLSLVPPELEDAAGSKLWVVAEEGGHVRAYGILREPSA